MGLRTLFRRRETHTGLPPGQRIYAVGDIHGRLDLFADLLLRIEDDLVGREDTATTLVVLGDFIDRGPEAARLIEVFMSERSCDRLVVLLGNHESALLDALRGDFDALDMWVAHGGTATLESFGVRRETVEQADSRSLLALVRSAIPAHVIDWLTGLPLSHRVGGYFFVHAGVRPGVPLARQSPDDLLWIRNDFTDSDADHGAVVVHGHTVEEPGIRIEANRIGVDTGAYRTGILSAVALEGDRSWQIQAVRGAPISDEPLQVVTEGLAVEPLQSVAGRLR